jgi:hypothetical protein
MGTFIRKKQIIQRLSFRIPLPFQAGEESASPFNLTERLLDPTCRANHPTAQA